MKKWYVSNSSIVLRLIIEENTGDNIAVAYRKEDAPLIAAAPELLEALQLLTDGIGRQDEFKSYSIEDGLAKARIAIAKVEGEKNAR